MYTFYQTYLHFENDVMFFYENLTEFNNEIDRNEICTSFLGAQAMLGTSNSVNLRRESFRRRRRN